MKILLIGFDGGTFRILEPNMQAGLMPNLLAIKSSGVSGTLLSTVPPITAPAWSSLRTGVNPGKHGVFSFTRPRLVGNGTAFQLDLNTARDVKSERVWNMLGQAGMRVGIASMPFTYPPEPVNGFMIADLMTCDPERGAAFPEDLKAEIMANTGISFRRSVADGMSITNEFLTHLEQSIREQCAMDCFLLRRYELDFFATVYQHSDTLQHLFWKIMDPGHPQYDRRQTDSLKRKVDQVFATLDWAVGQLIEVAQADTIFIVSDHGFQSAAYNVNVNLFLSQLGLLSTSAKRKPFTRLVTTTQALDTLARLDVFNLKRFLRRDRRKSIKHHIVEAFAPSLDLARSRAFLATSNDMGVFIIKGGDEEEYERTRRLIIDEFRDLQAPHTHEYVFDKVARREDLYWGPYIETAPDIIFIPRPGYALTSDVSATRTVIGERAQQGQSGVHAMDGIFLAQGRAIKVGELIQGAEIIDVTPTLLYVCGLPIPRYIDGKVLDIFDPQFALSHPVQQASSTVANEHQQEVHESVYANDEQERIMRRLADLGYL